jgi:type I restriction enzyme R subunit
LKPLYNPKYRDKLIEIKTTNEQIIDTISTDSVIFSWFDENAKIKAKGIIDTFKDFIEKNKEELELLKTYYNKSFKHKLTYKEVKEFAKKIETIPVLKKQETIWRAYRTLNPWKVIEDTDYSISDYLSLLWYSFDLDEKLEPFRYKIENKFEKWLWEKENSGIVFTTEQLNWLEAIRDEIANNINIEKDDFEYWNLKQRWGIGWAYLVFWDRFNDVIEEMNRELV